MNGASANVYKQRTLTKVSRASNSIGSLDSTHPYGVSSEHLGQRLEIRLPALQQGATDECVKIREVPAFFDAGSGLVCTKTAYMRAACKGDAKVDETSVVVPGCKAVVSERPETSGADIKLTAKGGNGSLEIKARHGATCARRASIESSNILKSVLCCIMCTAMLLGTTASQPQDTIWIFGTPQTAAA